MATVIQRGVKKTTCGETVSSIGELDPQGEELRG